MSDELKKKGPSFRSEFIIDGSHFSTMKGFYDEVERVFTFGLNWKIGRNLDAFNDILRGGFGRHDLGEPIHIKR
jgi:RNAse (barnase) inhibitor barstar